MKELVQVKKGEVFCDSRIIAEKFCKKHLYVVNKIEKLIIDLTKINDIKVQTKWYLKFVKKHKEYRGQNFKFYLLDKKAFSHYKVIFTLVKQELEQYGESLNLKRLT